MAKSLAEILAEKKALSAKTNPLDIQEQGNAPISEEEIVQATTKEPASIGVVNLASASKIARQQEQDFLLDELDATILQQATLTVEDIAPRIRQLDAMSDLEATTAMKQLKDALMANPAAVMLMLPEDSGTLVRTLRRITGQAIEQATAKKGKPAKEKKVDLKVLAEDF